MALSCHHRYQILTTDTELRQTVERQHNTWFRDQVEAGRQQLGRGDVLSHDMVESSAAAWRDEMSRKVAGK